MQLIEAICLGSVLDTLCLCTGVVDFDAGHRDEGQPKVTHFSQQPVQRRLIDHQARQESVAGV
jgi:hypothetical protein